MQMVFTSDANTSCTARHFDSDSVDLVTNRFTCKYMHLLHGFVDFCFISFELACRTNRSELVEGFNTQDLLCFTFLNRTDG